MALSDGPYVPDWLKELFDKAREGLAKTPPENRPYWLCDTDFEEVRHGADLPQ